MAFKKEIEIIIEPKDIFVGNKDAAVTLMEFGEYESEECAKANEVVKQLYKDNVKGSTISKKFVLNMEELGDVDVTFEIYTKNSNKPVVFEVTKNTRYVQDVVINKVK